MYGKHAKKDEAMKGSKGYGKGGTHRMANGQMMPDAEMERMHGGKGGAAKGATKGGAKKKGR